MSKANRSLKLPDEFIKFLERFEINRIKADVDTKLLSHPKASILIVKFFKLNNDAYLELVKLGDKNA